MCAGGQDHRWVRLADWQYLTTTVTCGDDVDCVRGHTYLAGRRGPSSTGTCDIQCLRLIGPAYAPPTLKASEVSSPGRRGTYYFTIAAPILGFSRESTRTDDALLCEHPDCLHVGVEGPSCQVLIMISEFRNPLRLDVPPSLGRPGKARQDGFEIRRRLPRHKDACEVIFARAERKVAPLSLSNGLRHLHCLLHAEAIFGKSERDRHRT